MANKLREAVAIGRYENLNRKNFWNIAMELCPLSVAAFTQWIDDYKRESYVPLNTEGATSKWGGVANGYKFHDLPMEMQVGIIFRFFYERSLSFRLTQIDLFNPAVWVDVICRYFMLEENNLSLANKR